MPSRAGFSLIELALVVVIISVIAAIAVPNFMAMQMRAKESEVTALAHVVQMAAENHAAKTGGIYSDLEADLRPCFPYGLLLVNPFSGDRTEPRFAAVAMAPGQVGIEVIAVFGAPVGYMITGYGVDGLVITYTGGS